MPCALAVFRFAAGAQLWQPAPKQRVSRRGCLCARSPQPWDMIASVAARATLPGALQPGKADRALMQAALVEPWYKLHVLTPEQAGDGVCLDGSPPGFFYSPPPLVGGRNDSWLLHLDGGGWCTDLEACKVRSKMSKGTSMGWKWAPDQAGILNTEAARNPTFHGFHKAVLKYCDGASFSGDVQDPVKVGNTRLYFRTPRVLNWPTHPKRHSTVFGTAQVGGGCSHRWSVS